MPWAIIGAGLTGLACARRLAELHPEDPILLLDARSIGFGASGRNSGFAVSTSYFSGPFDHNRSNEYQRINRINTAGLELLRAIIKRQSIECEWSDSGFYHCAADNYAQREYGYFIDYLQQLNIDHTTLDANQLAACFGTTFYAKGVHMTDGALLQPAALCRGLAATLPQNVSLHENTAVLSIASGQPLRLTTPKADLITDKLILATNYEAPKLGFLRRRMLGITLSGSFTRVLSQNEMNSLGDAMSWGILSLHPGGATLRLTPDRRICLRNTVEYCGAKLLTATQLKQRQVTHRAAFDSRLPQLKHVPFEYAWSGVEGISRNSTNFFGQVATNIYVAGGYNGSGLSRGTAFGYALAEYISSGQSVLIDDCIGSPKARRLPPRPLLDLGVMLSIKRQFRGIGKDR